MVVARTQDAYEDLVDQLVRHSVERVYTALVWRHLEHQRGVIDAPIGRSRRDPLKMTVALDGRESRTHYEVDAEFHEPIVGQSARPAGSRQAGHTRSGSTSRRSAIPWSAIRSTAAPVRRSRWPDRSCTPAD